MSLSENIDEKFAIELRSQIRDFNIKAIKYLAMMIGLVFIEIYFLGVVLKLGILVHVVAVPTGGYFLYKIISGFHKAVKCPRCGQPYNWSPRLLSAVPFVSKCQNCGLEISNPSRRKNIMSLKSHKSKIAYIILIIFFMSTAYFFLKLSASERRFLSYPHESVISEQKTEAIEIKGGSFFVTKEELEDHDFNKKASYILFLCTVVLMGVAYKLRHPGSPT
jgi:uncharacterized membrane protein